MNAPLAALQADFAAALRDRSPDAVPDGFSDAAARRFRVYRNNARVALIEALEAAYPAVSRLVGEPFFHRMAGVYAAAEPSRERTLNLYGETLRTSLPASLRRGNCPISPTSPGWSARCWKRAMRRTLRRSTRPRRPRSAPGSPRRG